MVPFSYYNPARIVFGVDAQKKLPALLSGRGIHALLLVYSGSFVEELGIYACVQDTCRELGIDFYADGRVVPNPSIGLVRELAKFGRERNVDFVLAAGGGSSIDTAKAVAMGIPYDGDVWDFFFNGVTPGKILPVGVITTLPSSGSETSNCAILSNGEWKLGYEDDRIIPQFAIMNPEYTLGLPPFQTAAGLADILSHMLERYWSDVPHTDVTDCLIEGGVRALLKNAAALVENPRDLDARAEVQWLASIAHNNLLDTGRVADWGGHRVEHELSAQYGITHGEGMAVVTLAWLKFAADEKPWKPAQLARDVFNADPALSERDQVLFLEAELRKFFKSLNLRTTLAELGIDDEHFAEMAERATRNGPVGHYIPLDREKFMAVLRLAQ